MKRGSSKTSNSGFASVGNILEKLLEKRLGNAGPQLKHLKIWEFWSEVVGKEIHKFAEPQNFKAGVLFIMVSHPTWTTELQYRAEDIRKKLNKKIGSDLVKELVFTVRKF